LTAIFRINFIFGADVTSILISLSQLNHSYYVNAMKSQCFLLSSCVALLVMVQPAFADGIVNKQSLSVDYTRSFTRHAATDYADIVVYNPAGVMRMENGSYIKLDFVTLNKDYTNSVPGMGEYDQADTFTVIPSLFALYKQEKWAGFFAVTIPGGGGIVDYTNGNATTLQLANSMLARSPFTTVESMSLEAKSYYVGYTFGTSYAFDDIWSVSAGLRYIDANVEAQSNLAFSINEQAGTSRTFEVDFEQGAQGMGGFVGVNIAPTEKLNIGLIYQSNTRLVFDTNINRDDIGVVNSIAKGREDLPGLFGAGLSYKLLPAIKVDVNLTWYLEKEATWEGRLAGQGDSYDAAVSLEYVINPQWKASAGYKATRLGIDADHVMAEAPELDADTVTVGGVWAFSENFDLSFSVAKVFYESVTDQNGITYDKELWGINAGMQWKF
jgi:long-chain fatty acid transport protein